MTIRELIDCLNEYDAEQMECEVRINGSLFSSWDITIDDEEEGD